ncbi:MAG TPA: hypothetical protein PK129_08325 [Cellvibrionaceae bacterium]|nr:hypothetical protein [Cellvibrionaceae bacterium]
MPSAFPTYAIPKINLGYELEQLPKSETVKDASGRRYIMGAGKLAHALGVDKMASRVSSCEQILGKTGIIYFENDHIDLWDKTKMTGNWDAWYDRPVYFLPLKN